MLTKISALPSNLVTVSSTRKFSARLRPEALMRHLRQLEGFAGLTMAALIAAPTAGAAEAKANWLPAPTGGFYLNLRLYGPDCGLPDGTWDPPPAMLVQ